MSHKTKVTVVGILISSALLFASASSSRADEDYGPNHTYRRVPAAGEWAAREYVYKCSKAGELVIVKDHIWPFSVSYQGYDSWMKIECENEAHSRRMQEKLAADEAKKSQPAPPAPKPVEKAPPCDPAVDPKKCVDEAMAPKPPSPKTDGIDCRDYASCRKLASTYSAATRAKIESNKDLYKSDPKKAHENEAEIRVMDAKTRAALKKAAGYARGAH